MKSMRLSQDTRRDILNKAVAVTFDKRFAALKLDHSKLAYRLYEAMVDFPYPMFRHFPKDVVTQDNTLYIKIDGRTYSLNMEVALPLPNYIRKSYECREVSRANSINGDGTMTVCGLPFPVTHRTIFHDIVDHFNRKEDLQHERDEYRRRMQGVLSSFTTTKQLVEAWPAVKQFIPEPSIPVTHAPPPAPLLETLAAAWPAPCDCKDGECATCLCEEHGE